MDDYQRRIIDDELDELFPALPAISLDGPKGVGKTATGSRRASTVLSFDSAARIAEISADPHGLLDRLSRPILLDEWQRYPPVWDVVRRAVDSNYAGEQFLLAGSAAPTTAPTHSGAGRITSLRMRPMSIAERVDTDPPVSLGALLQGEATIIGESDWKLSKYVDEILASGFPGVRRLTGRARRQSLDGYLTRIVERDMVEQGYRVRAPAALRAWLRAYASATASTTSYTKILDAATIGDANKPSMPTAQAYRDVLQQLWLMDPVEAWHPLGIDLGRITSSPKHHLADPALAARLMDLDEEQLLSASARGMLGPQEGAALGRLFEGLVTLSVLTYAQSVEARVSHYREGSGAREIDLIVEARGKVVAIEIKLSPVVNHAEVRHLLWLKDKLGDRLADAIVVTTGEFAYRRHDGIAVVPAALLGP